MTNSTHFRKLENMYYSAPFNTWFDIKLTIAEGTAELIIQVEEKLFHAANAVHGAIYFKALDDSAFFSANSLVEDVFVLTASFNIYLLRPIASGYIRAVGRVANQSKNQFIAESVAYNAEGKEIARGSGVFVRGKIPLSEDIGYRLNDDSA